MMFVRRVLGCQQRRCRSWRCLGIFTGILFALCMWTSRDLSTEGSRPVDKMTSRRKKQPASDGAACKLPLLDPFHPNVMRYYRNDFPPLNCKEKSYGSIGSGMLSIKAKSVKYAKLYRIKRPPKDDFKFELEELTIPKLPSTDDIDFTAKATGDFYKLIIKFKDAWTEHVEFLLHTDNVQEVVSDNRDHDSDKLDIMLLLFDSQSTANFKRSMSKTIKFLKDHTTTTVFKGHTIVGDGTTAQLTAMLTGDAEERLPEAKRGFEGSGPVDRWPFIFKWMSKHGYKTMFSEDDAHIGTFNYRLQGFQEAPSDHYSRTFFLATEAVNEKARCVAGKAVHNYHFDYLMSMFETYPENTAKFAYVMMSKISHNSADYIQLADDDVAEFLQRFQDRGYLNRTALFIMGDHGSRVAAFRSMMQGKLEERLAQFSLTLPDWFLKKHESVRKNIAHNSQYLTSHFDIHPTIKHLADYPKSVQDKYGRSLLTQIDHTQRTCEEAGVDEHWCPCLEFEDAPIDAKVMALAGHVIQHINDVLNQREISRSLCRKVELQRVVRAGKRSPSKVLEVFNPWGRRWTDVLRDLKEFVLGESTIKSEIYEIVLETKSSGALFEATVRIEKDRTTVEPNLSRLNKYGDQPKCIQKQLPSLRQYCHCK